MHSIERLIPLLEKAPLVSFSGFSFRVIADRWRADPLSAIGAFERGGRFNAPRMFPILYSADSQLTALLEVEALFVDAEDRLRGAPRNPDLILTLDCTLLRVLDLTVANLYADLGTSYEELVSNTPSRFLSNARNQETPTQQLGQACFRSGRISALKVPSAVNPKGYCLDILIESLVVGERVALLDHNGLLQAEVTGWIPKPI
ncbi:RES family NAD+ phosphorylase [Granulicella sp. S156]|uniref:RES family NAD+ phosphorylase n=1 Tax=Granulicella sp. S156 TaxID=1747224 RepID=UPI00131BD608|nr:RES family NAD+ phosphorylase [Granulicella sp. S156]